MRGTESIADWIAAKPKRGRYTFSREEVAEAFIEMSAEVLSATLSREVRKGRIMIPVNGFYVIIPDEYALRGFAPQPFYLDDMMRHLERNYYVALLSAGFIWACRPSLRKSGVKASGRAVLSLIIHSARTRCTTSSIPA